MLQKQMTLVDISKPNQKQKSIWGRVRFQLRPIPNWNEDSVIIGDTREKDWCSIIYEI
jgi:hypothetical protein